MTLSLHAAECVYVGRSLNMELPVQLNISRFAFRFACSVQ